MKRRDRPLVPLDPRLSKEALEVARERAARDGEGEGATLLDGLVLRLEDELGDGGDELVGRGERVEHLRMGRLVGHGGNEDGWKGLGRDG